MRTHSLPRDMPTGPRMRIVTRRPLTYAECRAAGHDPGRGWALLQLACGHHVIRRDNGRERARCGHCDEAAWQVIA